MPETDDRNELDELRDWADRMARRAADHDHAGEHIQADRLLMRCSMIDAAFARIDELAHELTVANQEMEISNAGFPQTDDGFLVRILREWSIGFERDAETYDARGMGKMASEMLLRRDLIHSAVRRIEQLEGEILTLATSVSRGAPDDIVRNLLTGTGIGFDGTYFVAGTHPVKGTGQCWPTLALAIDRIVSERLEKGGGDNGVT